MMMKTMMRLVLSTIVALLAIGCSADDPEPAEQDPGVDLCPRLCEVEEACAEGEAAPQVKAYCAGMCEAETQGVCARQFKNLAGCVVLTDDDYACVPEGDTYMHVPGCEEQTMAYRLCSSDTIREVCEKECEWVIDSCGDGEFEQCKDGCFYNFAWCLVGSGKPPFFYECANGQDSGASSLTLSCDMIQSLVE
jgi:hypothetical protein